MLDSLRDRLAHSAPLTTWKFVTMLALGLAVSFVAPVAQNFGSFNPGGPYPGMYADPDPSVEEPNGEAPPAEEPAEIGAPQSPLGKKLASMYDWVEFVAGAAAEHAPDEVDSQTGRVRDPLRGDIVYVPWKAGDQAGDRFSVEAGGEYFWLTVDNADAKTLTTTLVILTPESEPDEDPSAPNTFTGATAQEALDAAGATWQNNMSPLTGDMQLDLYTYGVKLANTTAAEVTIKFDGGEYVLERSAGDQGIYFIP
jgi:hypothetical protein